MNGCYCDLPGVDFPFSKEDFLTDHDIEMIHGTREGTPMEHNQLGALSAFRGQDTFVQSEKLKWSRYTYKMSTDGAGEGYRADFGTFNGNAIITDHKLKRDVWEWLNETLHPDYFQDIWKFASGTNTPPVTVLCFSMETGGWHNEGPVPHPGFDNSRRPPAVINFRLLGDVDNSYIEFAQPDEEMQQAEDEIVEMFIEDIKNSTEPDPMLTTATEHKNLIMASTLQLFHNNVWEPNLIPITKHVGQHNPYIVNVGKWHRVVTNGTPRVTFRIHANTDLTFEQIEKMVEAGEFFK